VVPLRTPLRRNAVHVATTATTTTGSGVNSDDDDDDAAATRCGWRARAASVARRRLFLSVTETQKAQVGVLTNFVLARRQNEQRRGQERVTKVPRAECGDIFASVTVGTKRSSHVSGSCVSAAPAESQGDMYSKGSVKP